jgi:hypothetical protein
MSDTISDNSNNENSTIQQLQSQVAAMQAKLDSFSSPSNNPYVVETAPVRELVPDEDLINAMPSINGKNFFLRPKGDDHTLALDRTNFLKNSLQSYKAPAVSELPWPPNSSEAQQFDKTLQSIQEQLARATRPVDIFASTVFTSTADEQTKSEILEFLHVMHIKFKV